MANIDWKAIPKWKLALAAVGIVYLCGFVVWGVYAATSENTRTQGPSELAANPERQDEILAQRRADTMQQQLDLSSEQRDDVEALIEEYTNKARAYREEERDPEVRRSKMIGLREQFQDDLYARLSPEQQAQFDNMSMPERARIIGRGLFGGPMSGMRGGGGGGGGFGRGDGAGAGRGDGAGGGRGDGAGGGGGFGRGDGAGAGQGDGTGQGYGVGRGRGR